MPPIRQVLYDAPSVQIPRVGHRAIALIIRPLDAGEGMSAQPDSERTRSDTPLMPKQEDRAARIAPRFSIAQVAHIAIVSRDAPNERGLSISEEVR